MKTVLGLFLAACLGMVSIPLVVEWSARQSRPATPVARPLFRIILSGPGDRPVDIRADAITRADGCILFWRSGAVDTILCEPVGRVLVTAVTE